MTRRYFAAPVEGAAFASAGIPNQDGNGEQTGGDPILVLIVEDHRVVAEGLAALINHQGDMKVVGQAGSVAECVTAAAELGPDVVLLDFRLPDGTGAEAATAMRGIRPEAKLIFLTREDTDTARFAAVQSGASAFIHKSKAASEVVDAIRDVARGRVPSLRARSRHCSQNGARLRLSSRASHRANEKYYNSWPRAFQAVRSLRSWGSATRPYARTSGACACKLVVHSKLEAIVKARELGLLS